MHSVLTRQTEASTRRRVRLCNDDDERYRPGENYDMPKPTPTPTGDSEGLSNAEREDKRTPSRFLETMD